MVRFGRYRRGGGGFALVVIGTVFLLMGLFAGNTVGSQAQYNDLQVTKVSALDESKTVKVHGTIEEPDKVAHKEIYYTRNSKGRSERHERWVIVVQELTLKDASGTVGVSLGSASVSYSGSRLGRGDDLWVVGDYINGVIDARYITETSEVVPLWTFAFVALIAVIGTAMIAGGVVGVVRERRAAAAAAAAGFGSGPVMDGFPTGSSDSSRKCYICGRPVPGFEPCPYCYPRR